MNDSKVRGWYDVECYNPDGSLAWEEHFPNMATTVGLNHMLNVEFGGTSQITAWYLGLITNSGFSGLSQADTMSTHGGWNESTNYSGTRPQWSPGTASSGSISNSSTVNFTMTSTDMLYGMFAVSDSTRGGTAGTLYATGAFSNVQSVVSGQVVKVTYTVSLTATSP